MKTKFRQCKYCGSELVCWNWIHFGVMATIKSWISTMKFQHRYKNLISFFSHNWVGECWECGKCIHTVFKVRNGIPKDVLNSTYVYLPKHELRDEFDELSYLFHHGWNIWNRQKLDERLINSLKNVNRLITERFNEYTETPAIERLIRDWEVSVEK